MKKIFTLVVAICAMMSVTDGFAQTEKEELALTLETMASPSAYKAFKKASTDVQYENLKSLLCQVEEAYQTCSTLDDFDKLCTSMYIIEDLRYKAKLRNTSQTYIDNNFGRLRLKIDGSIRTLQKLNRSAAKAEK